MTEPLALPFAHAFKWKVGVIAGVLTAYDLCAGGMFRHDCPEVVLNYVKFRNLGKGHHTARVLAERAAVEPDHAHAIGG